MDERAQQPADELAEFETEDARGEVDHDHLAPIHPLPRVEGVLPLTEHCSDCIVRRHPGQFVERALELLLAVAAKLVAPETPHVGVFHDLHGFLDESLALRRPQEHRGEVVQAATQHVHGVRPVADDVCHLRAEVFP